jgi:hypothetical protein
MKVQASIMEYILMTFFLLVVIVAMVLFMGWWNVTQLNIDQNKLTDSRALLLIQDLSSSEYIAAENSVLDDSKLTALKMMQAKGTDLCREFEPLFGREWFFEVRILDGNPSEECTFPKHPNCNTWTFCRSDQDRPVTIYNIPVNVHRKISGTNEIALLYSGVYT